MCPQSWTHDFVKKIRHLRAGAGGGSRGATACSPPRASSGSPRGFRSPAPIARRRARTLFDLVAGFTYSQILAACIDTGLLTCWRRAARRTATRSPRASTCRSRAPSGCARRRALGLVEPVGAGWMLGSDGAALLGNRGIAEMVAHHRLLYADLADPVALLRRGGGGGALSRHWRYAEDPAAGEATEVAAYSKLMSASQPLVAAQAIDAYRFDRHRRLLDVGGGEGGFLSAVGARVPDLDLALFDLPAVGARARARLDAAGLTARAKVYGGDFLSDPLPPGYDVVTLVRVLHDHDDAPALALLRNVHAALPDGGTIFITEPMAQTPGAEPAGDAYFGFYLLAMGSGRPRSVAEITAMLTTAGFSGSAWCQPRSPCRPASSSRTADQSVQFDLTT